MMWNFLFPNNKTHFRFYAAIFSEFILGDMLFTFLPIFIIALSDYFSGKLSGTILIIPEWSFSCMMISALSLTRILELKVLYQKDNSINVLILSRICIVVIIFSVISLVLTLFKEKIFNFPEKIFILTIIQFIILTVGTVLLYLAHYYKELLIFSRDKFPEKIDDDYFHHCLLDNLNKSKKKIRANCLALNKEYSFSEEMDDPQLIEEYGKQELKQLVEDIQNDLTIFKQRLDAWNKPPYHNAIPPEQQQDESL